MKHAALSLLLLAAFFFCSGCQSSRPAVGVSPDTPSPPGAPPSTVASAGAAARPPVYTASPNRILGYILALDDAHDLAIVDLTIEPIPPDLREGVELGVRTLDLRKTARLSATRFLRGRTLGAKILSGLPAVGEEVVLASP